MEEIIYDSDDDSSSEIICPHPDIIDRYECYSCNQSGCNKCILVVCCDCCVKMCNKCTDDDDILCGCYGICYTCGINVDRGEHGWPCSTCHEWFCSSYCHNSTGCKDSDYEESSSDESS